MNASQRFERALPELLDELGRGPSPEYRDVVVMRTAAMRQRPAWTFPGRWMSVDAAARGWQSMPMAWRAGAVVALLVLAALVAVFSLVGARHRAPAPPFGPAANGVIVYATGGDIYVGDPVTGTTRAIVTGPEIDAFPNFSLDGTHLLFTRANADGRLHEMLADADGTGVQAVTGEPLVNLSGGDWTGDGRFLVLVSDADGLQTMSIFGVEDGSVRTLTVGMAASDPVFRPPDGRQIAFVGGDEAHASVYIVGVDGTGLKRLAAGSMPRFSPDGTQIAFVVGHASAGSAEADRVEVHVMGVDGRDDHLVGDRPDVQFQGLPAWSPDGARILVVRAYYQDRYGRKDGLAIVPADGSGSGIDIDVSFTGGFGGIGWSPDGTEVVSMGTDESFDATLVVIADGTIRVVPRWYVSSWQRLSP